MKRILSILLCALMVVAIIPMSVFMVSAEDEVTDLYTNEFDTKMNPNGGSTTGCSREDNSDANDGKAMSVAYSTGVWKEPVALNNATGAVTVSLRFHTGTFGQYSNALYVNDVLMVTSNGQNKARLGGTTTSYPTASASCAQRWADVTVTISDLATGAGTVTYNDGTENLSYDFTLGEVTELNLQIGSGNSGSTLKVDYVKVTQVVPAVTPEPEPDPEPEVATNLFSTGAKEYAGWSNSSTDTYTVTPNGTDGDITVTFVTGNTNWQGKAYILTINGKTVFYGNGVSGSPAYSLGDDATTYSTYAGRTVTVVIDPVTGDASISDGKGNSANVNVGVISGDFNIVVGQNQTNSWNLTSLTVTQEAGNKLDTTTRAEYGYYNNDFTNVTSTGLIGTATINSSVEDGALKVQSSETNVWNVGSSNFPNDSIVSFKFMVPELAEGTSVRLLYSRTVSDYMINVSTNGVAMNIGTPAASVEAVANEWYTVTIIMTSTGSTVYCNGTLLGTSACTFAGRTGGWGLFNFNNAASDNTVTYYIDDLSVSTVADNAFVKVTGYQKTNVDAGKYNVRFIASVADLYAGQENVGFEITTTADGGKSWDKSTTTVYNSLTANYGTETVEASKLGGKYVTAMAITGIPSDLGTVELVVKPYVTINGAKIYGSAVTVTVNPVAE